MRQAQEDRRAAKEIGHDFYREVEEKAYVPLAEAMRIKDKLENYARGRHRCSPNSSASIPEDEVERRADAKKIFKDLKEKVMRDEILERGKRLDGRRFDEIRPIWIEIGVLPRVHGSAVFTRGETQALVSATLGTEDDAQKIETVDGETYKRFMLHYNFPPFSVGEVQFLRGPGRREVGHGALAERVAGPAAAVRRGIPLHRSASSPTSSNRTDRRRWRRCAAASLALMDAGVPLKAPVAGVAMGLVMDEKSGKWAVLSDIAGAEDHYGDMDFKVAGTRDGHHRAADGHQGRRHHDGHHAQGARAGARRAASRSSTRWRAALAGAAREHLRRSRRASSPSASRPRRFATSSDRAARPSAASSRRPASRSTSRTTAA